MTKVLLSSILCLFLFAACEKTDLKDPLLAPLSISGKIDCPQRHLTSLNPNEYVISLHDSIGVQLSQTRPTANGKYFFENLESGKTYQIRVKRTSANPPTLSVNQVKDYLQQTPLPRVSGLALLAADVDKSGEIDATDVLHIDRLIQGVTPSLPGGSWRIFSSYLIDANNNFIDFNTPSPLKNLTENISNYDFIVVTLGDMSLNSCN